MSLKSGRVAEAIVDEARDSGCDLIVIDVALVATTLRGAREVPLGVARYIVGRGRNGLRIRHHRRGRMPRQRPGRALDEPADRHGPGPRPLAEQPRCANPVR